MNKFIFTALVALLQVPLARLSAAEPVRPNVIVMIADDLGFGDVSCLSHGAVQTPNIDRLAGMGVTFTAGYVTAPLCAPSRAGFYTGLYQQRFGFFNNQGGIPVGVPLLPGVLRDAGYYTGLLGKWHSEGPMPFERGCFDETLCSPQSSPVISYQQPRLSRNGTVEQFYVYTTDLFAGEAEDFIERNKSKPFALTIAFNAPHIDHVVMPAGTIRSNYDAAVAAGEIYDVPKAPTARPGEAEAYAGQFPGDTARADTAATIVALDGAVGRILDKLQQAGLDQKTIIFLFSDNGGHPENRSENGVLRDYKWSHFEGGIHIPFLAAYPGVFPAGLQYTNPVSTLDIFPTVSALTGANPPTNLDGVDLTPYLLNQKTTSPHDALYFNSMQHWAIRQEQWKLVFEDGKLQLFNLATDLEEKYDLSAAEPVRVNELKQKWQAWSDQIPGVYDATNSSKANNTDDLNLTSSWVSGVVPANTNVALWDNAVTGANSVRLGSDLNWQGLAIANPGGAVTIQAGNTLTLGSSGIDMTNATHDLTLNCALNLNTNAPWFVAVGRQLLVNSPVGGTGGFTLSGGGFAALNAPNTFTGAITVANGTLLLAGAGNQSATTIQNGAVLRVADNASFGTQGLTIPVAGGSTGRLELTNNITVLSGQTLSMNGRNSTSDGIRNLGGSNTIAGTFSFGPGGANYWVQSDSGLLTLAGTVTAASSGSRTLTLQGTADGLVSGRIQNGNATMNLIKAGAGTWTLTATNTFTGSTTVNGGTLVVNGVINSPNNVTVATGGALSGRGTLLGPVTIQAGGSLAPGAGGIAALTISNSLTLAPASTVLFELNKGAHTNDSIRGLTSVSYDGSLLVTNLGGTLTLGDSFTLFQAAAYSGSFNQLVLPALAPELGWSNRLALDGSVLVVRTAPFKLGGAGSSGAPFSFDVDGPANQTYAIQATTNLSTTSSWVTLGWTNPVALPFRFIDPQANQFPQRFYRAVLGLQVPTNPPPGDPGAPPEPRVPLTLTYTLTDPDSGTNVGVWSTSGYTEDATWRSASSFSAIQDAMNQAGTKNAWVRFKATSTDLTYNSTFFASKHTGLITVWSEGEKNRWNEQGDGTNWLRYFSTIYRNDVVGTPTQYGVEYTADSSAPALIDFAFVQMQMRQVAELRNAGSDSTNFHQVLDIPHIRDVCAIKGPDNYYYMVGTPDFNGQAEGIRLFRSDSRSGPFTDMGLVWTFTNATWANLSKMNPTNDIVIWAPEISCIKGKWYIVYFPSVAPAGYERFQIGIATADNPLGPYLDATNTPIVAGTDPHLFEDDDGTVYLTYSPGWIAQMNSTMTGITGTPRRIYPHNSQSVAKEGTTLFKYNGNYYFSGALRIRSKYPDGTLDNTYDNVMCVSTNGIYGPYGDRFVAIKNGGNNSFFQDSDGKWYCTVWQPNQKPTIIAVELAPDGTWRPAENYDVLPSGTFY